MLYAFSFRFFFPSSFFCLFLPVFPSGKLQSLVAQPCFCPPVSHLLPAFPSTAFTLPHLPLQFPQHASKAVHPRVAHHPGKRGEGGRRKPFEKYDETVLNPASGKGRWRWKTLYNAYGHTMGKTPEPVRFQKLSLIRPS